MANGSLSPGNGNGNGRIRVSQLALNEYGSRLSRLEDHALSTERRLDEHSSKLDKIYTAVSVQEAVPKFSFGVALGYVKDAGILIGLAGAAIIYISSNISNAPLALLKSDQAASVALLKGQQESGFMMMQRELASMQKRLDSAEFARNWQGKVERP